MTKKVYPYEWTKKEKYKSIIVVVILDVLVAYLFFNNIIAAILISPVAYILIRQQKDKLMKQKKWQLNLEFRDAAIGIIAALNAGYSMENSILEASKDLHMVYPKDSWIIQEFEGMYAKIKMNKNIEELLEEFAMKSGLEDIQNFSQVLSTAKRSGGDLMKILRSTVENLTEKIEVKREIQTLITAKKFEVKIMNGIPLFFLVYMRVFSKGFLDPLYNSLSGTIFMGVILVVYIAAYMLSEKIMDIEV